MKQNMRDVTQRNIGIFMMPSSGHSVIFESPRYPDNRRRRNNCSRWKNVGRVSCVLIGIFLFGSLLLHGQSSNKDRLMQSNLRGDVAFTHSPTYIALENTSAPQTMEELTWASYTMGEMWQHLNCDKALEQGRPIYGQETWREMRNVYTSIVGHEKSTIGSLEFDYNGFAQPYFVRHNQYGRGIYAAMDIPEGALVWQNIRSAQFSEGASYREFVMRVPPDLACDVLQWGYVDYDHKINVDLDEGSLCNDGGNEGNIDFDEERSALFPVRPHIQLFANTNISKDEELLCNYGGFSSAAWSDFGL
jgi:hypothetical protein